MIKLICSDVDGTLLQKNKREISGELISQIKELTDKGVLFAVASGRPYCELRRLFEAVADRILFICSDGALIIKGDKVLRSVSLCKIKLQGMIDAVWDRTKYEVVLYGKDFGYRKERAWSKADNSLKTIGFTREIDEHIYKIAFYNPYCKEKSVFLKGVEADFSNYYSDNGWHEYIRLGENKGTALKFLQEQFGVLPTETVAFGDNFNDVEMLLRAEQRYAMINGKFKVQTICKRTILRVEDTLNTIIKEMGR